MLELDLGTARSKKKIDLKQKQQQNWIFQVTIEKKKMTSQTNIIRFVVAIGIVHANVQKKKKIMPSKMW